VTSSEVRWPSSRLGAPLRNKEANRGHLRPII
jgi:hypothetical protein